MARVPDVASRIVFGNAVDLVVRRPRRPPHGLTAAPERWRGGAAGAASTSPHPPRRRRRCLVSADTPAAPPRSGYSTHHRPGRRTPLRPASALAPVRDYLC